MTSREFAEAVAATFKRELGWGTEFGLDERGLQVEHDPDSSVVRLDRYQPSPNPSLYKLRKFVASVVESNGVDPTKVRFSPWRGHVLVQLV